MSRLIRFLTNLFRDGLSYSAINTARSAVSSFSWSKDNTIGNHVLVNKFIKGVFNLRPALPRTSITWDTSKVLNFLKTWHPAKNLSLRQLSIKTVILLLLVSGQRGQTAWVLKTKDIEKRGDSYICRITDPLKTSSSKHHKGELLLKPYIHKNLCVVHYLTKYLERTKPLRGKKGEGGGKLFIITRHPYREVSRDTIGKWTREGLALSGINMEMFTPHSTRAASTSKAKMTVKLKTILKTAGWRRAKTFAKFYDKVIEDAGWGIQDLN